jgi:hypothetical protein
MPVSRRQDRRGENYLDAAGDDVSIRAAVAAGVLQENSADKELTVKAKFALAGCLEAGDNLTEALKLYQEIEPEYPNKEAIQIKIKALETRIIKKRY